MTHPAQLLDSPSFPLARARQNLFDDVANRAQLVDPCRIEPKKLGAFHTARPLADLFLGDIFPQRIVKAAGSMIGIEPRRLSFSKQRRPRTRGPIL